MVIYGAQMWRFYEMQGLSQWQEGIHMIAAKEVGLGVLYNKPEPETHIPPQ